jgi:hypothetical protein
MVPGLQAAIAIEHREAIAEADRSRLAAATASRCDPTRSEPPGAASLVWLTPIDGHGAERLPDRRGRP